MFTLTVTARADAPRQQRHRLPTEGDRERGTITLMLLIMFVALLALAGIVIDGGANVDQAQALTAALQYLAHLGYRCCAVADGPDAIRVTVTVIAPTHVLSIIGIDTMRSTGSATASLATGVTGPGT